VALKILTDEVRTRANADAQFLNAARLWNFELLLRVGFDNYMMSISDGRIARFDVTTDIFERHNGVLGGTEDDWQQLLTPVPPPFYQDFFGAFFQHGFQMSGDLDSMFAHYWALLRLLAIMRATHNEGAAR
jgi:hypothetical protein